MNKSKKAKNQPKIKGRELPPLLPLEYCRIDRAARLLNCEVEDILHWGAIGSIRIGVFLIDTSAELRLRQGDFKGQDELVNQLRESDFGSFSEKAFTGKYGHVRLEEECDLVSTWRSFYSIRCRASGMWQIPRDGVLKLYLYGVFETKMTPDNCHWMLLYTTNLTSKNGPFSMLLINEKEKISFNINDLFVLGADVIALYNSITNNKALPNIYNNAELALEAKHEKEKVDQTAIPHGNTDNNAVTREAVLKAAMACKKHFSDQCKTYVAWVKTIEDKAPLFWPETGEPPLATDTIERLLGNAHKLPNR